MSLLAMYLYLHEDNVQPFQTDKGMKCSKVFGVTTNQLWNFTAKFLVIGQFNHQIRVAL